jgi:hypothetical protein
MSGNTDESLRFGMSNAVWDTKDGRRRVRRDPPTIEEAVLAAQGLSDELGEQTEIVASLMHISADEARRAVLRLAQPKSVDRITITATARTGRAAAHAAPRAVVVERRMSRRAVAARR